MMLLPHYTLRPLSLDPVYMLLAAWGFFTCSFDLNSLYGPFFTSSRFQPMPGAEQNRKICASMARTPLSQIILSLLSTRGCEPTTPLLCSYSYRYAHVERPCSLSGLRTILSARLGIPPY